MILQMCRYAFGISSKTFDMSAVFSLAYFIVGANLNHWKVEGVGDPFPSACHHAHSRNNTWLRRDIFLDLFFNKSATQFSKGPFPYFRIFTVMFRVPFREVT